MKSGGLGDYSCIPKGIGINLINRITLCPLGPSTTLMTACKAAEVMIPLA